MKSLFALIIVVLLANSLAAFSTPEIATSMEAEDGWIESLGALFFFLAAALFAMAFLKSGGSNTANSYLKGRRNWMFIPLFLLCFLAAGEEISWGQRIIGWETPEAIKEINAQEETNLHNLTWFQVKNEDGTLKSQWGRMLTATRLLAIFLLGFLVVLPLLSAVPALRRLMISLAMPVPEPWPGLLLIASYVGFRVFLILIGGNEAVEAGALNELKETCYGLTMFYAAYAFRRGAAVHGIKRTYASG